jgi:hypothetical protein
MRWLLVDELHCLLRLSHCPLLLFVANKCFLERSRNEAVAVNGFGALVNIIRGIVGGVEARRFEDWRMFVLAANCKSTHMCSPEEFW